MAALTNCSLLIKLCPQMNLKTCFPLVIILPDFHLRSFLTQFCSTFQTPLHSFPSFLSVPRQKGQAITTSSVKLRAALFLDGFGKTIRYKSLSHYWPLSIQLTLSLSLSFSLSAAWWNSILSLWLYCCCNTGTRQTIKCNQRGFFTPIQHQHQSKSETHDSLFRSLCKWSKSLISISYQSEAVVTLVFIGSSLQCFFVKYQKLPYITL